MACQGEPLQLVGSIHKLRSKRCVENMVPGTVFTTLHSLCNWLMDPICKSYIPLGWKVLPREIHISSLGPFISYEENEVLRIHTPGAICMTFHILRNLLVNTISKSYITLGWKVLPETNTSVYWAHLWVKKKIKCCETHPGAVITKLHFLLLTQVPNE